MLGKLKAEVPVALVGGASNFDVMADGSESDWSGLECGEAGIRNARPPKPPADESLVALSDLPCHPSAAPRKGPAGGFG